MPGTGWAANMPEEAGTTVPGRSITSRGPVDDAPSSIAAPVAEAIPVNNLLASTSDAHLEGMREMLRVMGNVPDGIIYSVSYTHLTLPTKA